MLEKLDPIPFLHHIFMAFGFSSNCTSDTAAFRMDDPGFTATSFFSAFSSQVTLLLPTWYHALALACLIPTALSLLLHFFAMIYAKHNLHPKLRAGKSQPTSNGCSNISHYNVPISQLPRVSILKPIVTLDATLAVNLTSFFQMDYPLTHYEVLICVANMGDAACDLARDLMKKYPQVDARLFEGSKKIGVNPKINNMNEAYEVAKYEYILVSDCGIYMRPDTLTDICLTAISQPNVGLVHQPPYILPTCEATPKNLTMEQRFCRMYQKVFFGTWHAKIYLGAKFLRINCITGMSCLMLKRVIDEAGGLKAFSNYLAEDFFLARLFASNGWTCLMSGQPAWQNTPPVNVAAFRERLIRWSQLRFAMIPFASPLEPFSQVFAHTAMIVGTSTLLFPNIVPSPLIFYLSYFIMWLILDYALFLHVEPSWSPMDYTMREFLTAWLYREATAVSEQIKSICRSTIRWHGSYYRLRWGGFTKKVNSSPISQQNMSEYSNGTFHKQTKL